MCLISKDLHDVIETILCDDTLGPAIIIYFSLGLLNYFFKRSFRSPAKLRGRYRAFLHIPYPTHA